MQAGIQSLKISTSVKALVIGVLILLLLIPVSMIKGVVHDRNNVHQDARRDIMRSWGFEQLVAGPVLTVPYRWTITDSDGDEHLRESRLYLLPKELRLESQVNPEVLRRGLHQVPTFNAAIDISGEFTPPDRNRMDRQDVRFDWSKATVVLSVSDARAITETPDIRFGGQAVRFESGGRTVFPELAAPITAPVGGTLADGMDGSIPFSMTLHVNGSDTLQFVPLGDTTEVSMTSTWASPSFLGNYLPQSRNVSDDGFSANWKIASLGRSLPAQWSAHSDIDRSTFSSAFGVSFYMPVGLYQLSLRATKYAVLFIVLSFVAYFLFEIMAKLRLHPLQYLMVGFANAMFYLLLLSLAEHIGFGLAYATSATASIALIAGYSSSILGGRTRGMIMAIILTGLYSFLYMTLNAENFALLVGSIALWATLATVMYLTRRIDWYSGERGENGT